MALGLLAETRANGTHVDIGTYNSWIHALMLGNQLEWVVELFKDMPAIGLQPDETTFNVIIKACENAGQWQWALRFLEDMRGAGFQPDVHTYASVISVCEKGDQCEWALHVFTNMQKEAVAPTQATYNALIALCNRSQQKEWASVFKQQMEQAFPSSDFAKYISNAPARTPAPVGQVRTAPPPAPPRQEAPPAAPAQDARAPGRGDSAEEGASGLPSTDEISEELDMYEDPAVLWREAVAEGAFSPWEKQDEVFDLHGLSVDVSKVAIYAVLSDLLTLPTGHPKLNGGLRIVIGRGLNSDEGRVVGPAVFDFLTRYFLFELPPLDDYEGTIKLFAKDIRHLSRTHPYFLSLRKKRKKKEKS